MAAISNTSLVQRNPEMLASIKQALLRYELVHFLSAYEVLDQGAAFTLFFKVANLTGEELKTRDCMTVEKLGRKAMEHVKFWANTEHSDSQSPEFLKALRAAQNLDIALYRLGCLPI